MAPASARAKTKPPSLPGRGSGKPFSGTPIALIIDNYGDVALCLVAFLVAGFMMERTSTSFAPIVTLQHNLTDTNSTTIGCMQSRKERMWGWKD
jgi:hypothetical protein